MSSSFTQELCATIRRELLTRVAETGYDVEPPYLPLPEQGSIMFVVQLP